MGTWIHHSNPYILPLSWQRYPPDVVNMLKFCWPPSRIGVITFRDHPPKPAGEYWNGFQKRRMYYPDRQGYYRLEFKAEKHMASYVKAGTLYGKGCSKEEWDAWVLENYPNNPKFAKEEEDG